MQTTKRTTWALPIVFIAVFLFGGCVRVQRSHYQRFELPKNLDSQSEQRIFFGVVDAMRSEPFVGELKKRFPSVTQAQLLNTDIRWDVVTTGSTRSFFISVGVKDTSDFPEAKALVDFFFEYGQAQARSLVESPPSRGQGATS